MSFAKRGYDDIPDGDGGGGNGFNDKDPAKYARFKVGIGGTKRLMFLDNNQFAFYEHGLFKITGKTTDKCLCLAKNKLDSRGCPLCDVDNYAAFVGYLSAIDMGDVSFVKDPQSGQMVVKLIGYQGKKKYYHFDKKLLGARRGSNDKPGMMLELKRLADRRGGDLTGTVWDTTRPGKLDETCGTRYEFVERVPQAQWKDYLLAAGAAQEHIDEKYSDDTSWLEPYNYDKMFIPPEYEAMARLAGLPPPKGAAGKVAGAGYDGGTEGGSDPDFRGGPSGNAGGAGQPDDDIPF